MGARLNGHERPGRYRGPHTRCRAAACATRLMGAMGSDNGGSAAGTIRSLAGSCLLLQSLLRPPKEGAHRLRFDLRGDGGRAQVNWLAEKGLAKKKDGFLPLGTSAAP